MKAGFSQRTVKLKNGLGTVSLYLPNELDTFYTHRHTNDIPDDGFTYRFSSKKYYVFHDTVDNWYFSTELPDSLNEFEIVQYDYPDLVGDSAHFTKEYMDKIFKTDLLGDFSPHLLTKDTIINDRRYRFAYYRKWDGYNGGHYNNRIYAQTYINGYKIEFQFVYSGKCRDAFFNRATASLSTLQVAGLPNKKYTTKDVKKVIYDVYCTGPSGTEINYKLTKDSLFVDSSNHYRYGLNRGKGEKVDWVPLDKALFEKEKAVMDSLPSIFLNCNTNQANFGRGPAYFNHCWVLIEIEEEDRKRYFTVDTDWEGVPEEVKKYAKMIMRIQL